MAKSNSTSTSKEKVTGLIYVLSLFLITTGICGYILFVYNSDYRFANGKKDALSKLERVRNFQNAQSEYIEKIMAIDNSVNSIDPSVNASYLKQNLNYEIGEIKKISGDNNNKYDARFKIFDHVASFYEMKLFDKERLSVSLKNIEKFKADLDKCRGGVETLKNE
ncbi:MAG: type VI secretion system transmembrane protein TssO [Paludibacteraceae bacterium]|nr:type VI secretion system transmembrane protein TssO [Paludibacteraceae bacterium]